MPRQDPRASTGAAAARGAAVSFDYETRQSSRSPREAGGTLLAIARSHGDTPPESGARDGDGCPSLAIQES